MASLKRKRDPTGYKLGSRRLEWTQGELDAATKSHRDDHITIPEDSHWRLVKDEDTNFVRVYVDDFPIEEVFLGKTLYFINFKFLSHFL